jgi:Ca-activated chloride channel homolog
MKKLFLLLFMTSSICYPIGFIDNIRAACAYFKGDLDKAQHLWDTVLTNDAADYKAAYNRAKVAYAQNEFNAAEAYFEKALSISQMPGQLRVQAWFDKGNSQVQQKKYSEAISSYQEVLKLDESHKPAKDMIEQLKKAMEQQKQEQQDKQDDQKSDDQQKDDDKQDQQKQDNEGSDSDNSQDNQQKNNQDQQDGKKNTSNQSKNQKNDQQNQKDKEKQQEQQDKQKDMNNNQQQKDNGKDKNKEQQQKEQQKKDEQDGAGEQQKQQEQKQKQQGAGAAVGNAQEQQQQEKKEEDEYADLFKLLDANDSKMLKDMLKDNLKKEAAYTHGQKNW